MTTQQQKTVIPYTHGRGKTGHAKTGEERILIAPTDHYPNAFEEFKRIVRNAESGFHKRYPEELTPPLQKQLMTMIQGYTGHVNELKMPDGEEVIFLNIDKFKTAEFNRLISIKVDGQEVMI